MQAGKVPAIRDHIVSRLHQAFRGQDGHIAAAREWETRDDWGTREEIRAAMMAVRRDTFHELRRLHLTDVAVEGEAGWLASVGIES